MASLHWTYPPEISANPPTDNSCNLSYHQEPLTPMRCLGVGPPAGSSKIIRPVYISALPGTRRLRWNLENNGADILKKDPNL